jgi:acyl-CoA synthetase (AMP-forming)/AMP-acid ligase II
MTEPAASTTNPTEARPRRAIDVFDEGAQRHPDRVCFRFGDQSLTYREVESLSRRVAAALASEGFGRGAHAAVLSANHPCAFVCVLGILRAGGVWLSINARNSADENIRTLRDFDCDVLFYHSEFDELVADLPAQAPRVRRRICIDRSNGQDPALLDWASASRGPAPVPATEAGDLAILSATGGTTGRPRGVMLTQENFITFCDGVDWQFQDDRPPVFLAAAPMTHVGGRFCFPVMRLGGTVVVLKSPEPQAILAAIQDFRITRLFLPPTAIYTLLAQPNVRDFDFSSLHHFTYGGAPMSVQKLKEAIEVFGPVMTQGYGQTEAPMLIAYLAREDHFKDGQRGGELAADERLASCGKPTPFSTIAIMDESGRLLPRGKTGEIVVRGAFVMKGYYKDPEATAAASQHGWHHTGDLGRFDDEGYLQIVDRKKDMIVTGGFNVYSAEVEQVVCAIPGVHDCVVIGVPDEKWGEAVKAVVQLKPNAVLTEADVIAACRPVLGGVKTPKSVEFRGELPRSATGKVLKRAVRDPYWAGRSRKV